MKKRFEEEIDYFTYEYYDKFYFLFIGKLIGKFLKRGNKLNAIKFYNNLKENIKLQRKEKRKKENPFVFLLAA
jgi:hypothetical protein